MLRLTTLVLLASASLAGCMTQPPSPMYRLDGGSPDAPARERGAAVLLGPVQLADYLRHEAVLERLADGSLVADDRHARWAGSLEQDVNQLLLNQLASRLDTQLLELAPASKGFAHDVQVEVRIIRLDSGALQPAVLEAQWLLFDSSGKRRASRLVRLREEHQGDTADQVRAQGVLLQRLSELMADSIAPLVEKSPMTRRPAKAPSTGKRDATVVPPPPIKTIEPQRTDMEVFRF